MEVTVRGDRAVFQDHRVVDCGSQFTLGNRLSVRDCVAYRTGNLWVATQRVCILYAGAFLHDVGDDRGVREPAVHVGGRTGLARVRTQRLVELRREHGVTATQALDRHRGGQVGNVDQVTQVIQSHEQHAEHAVGSVDEGQALLLGELERLNTGFGKQLRDWTFNAFSIAGAAFAEQHDCAVGERREVAGATE